MRSWTFSLTSLLGTVTLLGLDLGAMVSDSHFMASAAYTAFLGLLCFSVAAAWLAAADRRAFWLGFAVFGMFYWLGAFNLSAASSSGNRTWYYPGNANARGGEQPYFIADTLLDLAEEHIMPRRAVGSHVYARWQGGGYYWGTIIEADGGQYRIKWDDGSAPTWQTVHDLSNASSHRRVGMHAGVATLWSILGGAIVALWAGRQRSANSNSTLPRNGRP